MKTYIKTILSLSLCLTFLLYSMPSYALSANHSGPSFNITVGQGSSSTTGSGNKEQTGSQTSGSGGSVGSVSKESNIKSYIRKLFDNTIDSGVGTNDGRVTVNKAEVNKYDLKTNLDVYYDNNLKNKVPDYSKDLQVPTLNQSADTLDAQNLLDRWGGKFNTGSMDLNFPFNNNGTIVKDNLGISDFPTLGDRNNNYNTYISTQCITDTVEIYQIKEYKFTAIEYNKKVDNKAFDKFAVHVYSADSLTDYDCVDNPDNYLDSAIQEGNNQFTFSPAYAGFYAILGFQYYEKTTSHYYACSVLEYYVLAETGDVIYKTSYNLTSSNRNLSVVPYWRLDVDPTTQKPIILELTPGDLAVLWIKPTGLFVDLNSTERIE